MTVTLQHDNERQAKTKQPTKDGGWAWLVAFCSCFGIALATSLISSFGILYTAMLDVLPFEFTSLTVIGAVHTALSCFGAPIAVPIIHRFGVRAVLCLSGIVMFAGCVISAYLTSLVLLILCLGIIPGLSASFAYIAFFIGVTGYFDKKKSIGIAIASSGNSVAFIIVPQILQLFIDCFGYQGSVVVLSGLLLNICVCGAVILPLQQTGTIVNDVTKITQSENLNFKFLKSPGLVVSLFSNTLMVTGAYIPFVFLPYSIQSKGLSLNELPVIFIGNGIFQCLGRFCFGYCSERKPRYSVLMWIISFVSAGLSFLVWLWCTEMVHFVLVGCVFGFLMGGVFVGATLTIRNFVDDTNFSRALSLCLFFQGCGGLIGSPLASFLQEETGSSLTPFYFGCGVLVLGGFVLIPFWKKNIQMETEISIEVKEKDAELSCVSSGKYLPSMARGLDSGMNEGLSIGG